jgi:hypothetical protein
MVAAGKSIQNDVSLKSTQRTLILKWRNQEVVLKIPANAN